MSVSTSRLMESILRGSLQYCNLGLESLVNHSLCEAIYINFTNQQE